MILRGFYRIWGVTLLAGLPVHSLAADACEDLRPKQRSYADQLMDDAALHGDAGSVDLRTQGISRMTDGVRLRFGRDVLYADNIEYEHSQRKLRVFGQTEFENDAILVEASGAQISLDEESAGFQRARYVTYAAGARGEASQLIVSQGDKVTLKDVRYTSCPANNESWVLESDNIKLDSERGQGSAHNARLRFKGVPIFWAPLLYFPFGDQRQTGLLPPKIGEGGNTGLDISLPIYLNLAPHYDLLLTPRYMATRGTQMAAQARYLWSHSEMKTTLEWLGEDEQTGEKRDLIAGELHGGTDAHWNWQMQYTSLSDAAYLSELDTDIADPAQSLLPRYFRLNYYAPNRGLNASLQAHGYQNLTPLTVEPYERAPELELNWQRQYANQRLRPGLGLNIVNFRRDKQNVAWRQDANFRLHWRYDRPAAFAYARGDYRLTSWQIDDDSAFADTNPSRALPSLQAGGGLNFLRLESSGNITTLTPQLSYVYVPYRNQSDLPLFDSGLPDFSFDQLFARNRYTGTDRVADANLMTLALSSNWLGDGGRQRRLSGKLGVQWRFEASQITLPGEKQAKSGSSDWLGELDYQVNHHLSARMVGQWNAEDNKMDQSSVSLRYGQSDQRFIYLGYRFRRDNFEQTDAIASLPLGANWSLAGRWTYSLKDKRSLESLGGFEYRSCCWGAQLAWRRYLSSSDGEFDRSIVLQLELTGLGTIGQGLDRLLTRDIL